MITKCLKTFEKEKEECEKKKKNIIEVVVLVTRA